MGGFVPDMLDRVRTAQQFKLLLREFINSISTEHIKVQIERLDQYDIGEIHISFTLALVCLDDPYLDHSGRYSFRKNLKFHSCASSFYVKDSYYELVKEESQRLFFSQPSFNNTRSLFSIAYQNDHIVIKSDKKGVM